MSMKSYVLVVAALSVGVFVFPSPASTISTDNYQKKLEITVSGYDADSETLSDFPALVKLSTAIQGFFYGDFKLTNGADLRFALEDGTLLSSEVDTWNASGTSLVWVKVPAFKKDAKIIAYYGATNPDAVSATDVWSAGYVGVYHLGESALPLKDSSGKATNFATAIGSGMTYAATGAVGGAVDFGATGNSRGLKAADDDDLDGTSAMTLEAWTYQTSHATAAIVCKREGYNVKVSWQMYDGNGTTQFGLDESSTGNAAKNVGLIQPDASVWAYQAHTYDSSLGSNKTKGFLNGVLKSSGTTISGKVRAGEAAVYLGHFGGTDARNFPGKIDELRISNVARSAAWLKASYDTVKVDGFLTYGAVKDLDESAPVIESTAVVRNPNGSYTVSAVISMNKPASGSVKCVLDEDEYEMTTSDADLPQTYSVTLTDLSADSSYSPLVKATSVGGTDVKKNTSAVFYTGTLTVTKGADADEADLMVPGTVIISRADAKGDLVVNYLTNGTAVAGVNYVALPEFVTITNGANSATVEIFPLRAKIADTTVDVTLAAGLYGVDDAAKTATVNIRKLSTPEGWNTWVASADGLASVAENWSDGVPKAGDKILFDGNFSSANCEWNGGVNGLTDSVAAWSQTSDYTGTVTIDTTFAAASATFTCLTVTGDMSVEGGKLTHPRGVANVSVPTSRIKLAVGGNFTLAAGTKVDLKGKGLAGGQRPAGSTAGSHAASADGYGKVYGNVYAPELPGAGADGANNWGGGAFWLECAGDVALNGTITVRTDEKENIRQPAAGSVYIKAKSCTGTGYIYADYESSNGYYNGGKGSGGRVAIVLTEATSLGLAESHVGIKGIICSSTGGGGGTFFLKTADQENGTLILDDYRYKDYARRWRLPTVITAIPASETWKFDAIKIKNYGMLAIPEGTTLELPNGPKSITASSNNQGGLLYQGGTIKWGSAPYEFSSPWIFQANVPYTFDGDVVIKANGRLGCMTYQGATDFSNMTKCDITVNGNLTIEKNGAIYANGGGPDMNISRNAYASHGGATMNTACLTTVYDSVFNPQYPGYTASSSDYATSRSGGGLVRLTVNGDLVVNGTISADGSLFGDVGAAGSGGTVNITAKTLSGTTGTIQANSTAESRWMWFDVGGAGRVRVKLTEGTFDDYWKSHILARGRSMWNGTADHGGSAGTVFLQEAGQTDSKGVVYVRNDGAANPTQAYTYLPVTSTRTPTDDISAYKRADLVIGGKAIVKVSTSFALATLQIASASSMNLNGKTVTVSTAVLNGTKLKPGTYTAASGEVSGFVTDSGTGGELIVKLSGMVILIQ